MRSMPADQVAVMSAVISLILIALLAVAIPIAAAFLPTRRRGLLTIALCLWFALAGFTLSSAVWSWMTDANLRYVQTQLEHMPPDTLARDAKPYTMPMLVFFLILDHLGRKLLYAPVVIPLILCVMGWWKAQSAVPKMPKVDEIDSLFRE